MATEVTFQSSFNHGAILSSGDLAIQPVDYILQVQRPHALCENGHMMVYLFSSQNNPDGSKPNALCVFILNTNPHVIRNMLGEYLCTGLGSQAAGSQEDLRTRDSASLLHNAGRDFFLLSDVCACTLALSGLRNPARPRGGTYVFDIGFFYSAGCLSFYFNSLGASG